MTGALKYKDGTAFHVHTSEHVMQVLEYARRQQFRIRIFYGDRDTGRCWMEEHGVSGLVSRSMGPEKVPLLVYNRASVGGDAILTNCIMRIVKSTGREGKSGRASTVDLYRHPEYKIPELHVHPFENEFLVTDETGHEHARFYSEAKAKRWIRYMRGECIRP